MMHRHLAGSASEACFAISQSRCRISAYIYPISRDILTVLMASGNQIQTCRVCIGEMHAWGLDRSCLRYTHQMSDILSGCADLLLSAYNATLSTSWSLEKAIHPSKMAGVRIEAAAVSVTTTAAGTSPALAEVSDVPTRLHGLDELVAAVSQMPTAGLCCLCVTVPEQGLILGCVISL